MNPICTSCRVIMKCKKNGYTVGFIAGRRYSSDLFTCQECGVEVAILAAEPYPDPPENGKPVEAQLMMREDQ